MFCENLFLTPRPELAPKIIYVRWQPSPPGWFIVNTDASVSGSAGGGGFFRNNLGHSLGCFSLQLPNCHAFLAELRTAIHAINIAVDKGWNFFRVERDSVYVVNTINSRSSLVPWLVRMEWLDCMRRMSSITVVESHIFREGNHVADALARHGRLSLCFS